MSRTATRQFAPLTLAAGLVMLAVAATALVNRLDVDLSTAVAAGCALVLAGVVWMIAAIARARRVGAKTQEPG